VDVCQKQGVAGLVEGTKGLGSVVLGHFWFCDEMQVAIYELVDDLDIYCMLYGVDVAGSMSHCLRSTEYEIYCRGSDQLPVHVERSPKFRS
jgi:hypothetical protein